MPKPSPSILTVLWLIQQRPSMYLGGDDDSRRKQLDALQFVIEGYSLALRQHQVGNEDLAVIGELETFLRERAGTDDPSGISEILATSATEAEACDRVWSLIDEFRASKGHVP